MTAGFARLQPAENQLLPGLLRNAGIDWLLELAPIESPSPALGVPRHRALLSGDEWCYPFRAPAAELPFGDECLPAVMVRHLFQSGVPGGLLEEVLRCLKPGGLLVSVSANPWHSAAWRELGRRALLLPAWPHLLMRHARFPLQLEIPRRDHLGGFVPGISPLLVVVSRKPPRPAQVGRLRFREAVGPGQAAGATQFRAAA